MGTRIPKISDLKTAVRIYYEYPELGNKEISELFEPISSSTITKLKHIAFERAQEYGIKTNYLYTVNTDNAYKAWGLDIDDLIMRLNTLKSLNMLDNTEK